MASILLSAAGASLGGGSVFGMALGGAFGRALGGVVDNAIFGQSVHREGARLEELSVQTSTYGKMIPQVFGSARIAGNIIWARPLKEVAETTETSTGGKGGGGGSASQTNYSYYATLAIAICEGEIDEVLRIWADAKLLDVSQGTYRIYKGSETQLPDALIEGFEGIGKTPAYRGLAYIVVEDFPLAAFGNRIPNFTFEVKRKVLQPDIDGVPVEEMIKEIILIPGSGEFVYDDTIQYKIAGEQAGGSFAQQGHRAAINYHNTQGKANAMLALDQLEATCPNVEWVGLVVTWFGDNLDAASCKILPGVEFKTGATTSPDIWQVGSYSRDTARQITMVGDTPRYGGTPDDSTLLRYIDAIRARGLKIMFYPMFFMDVENKPWRGRVTGSASAVADFFTKTEGYNAFITHYTNLVAGKVDAFVIGSELVGLTKVSSSTGVYPAVNALVSLAASVKSTLGSSVKVTYAADWSEYHHTDGGWYHLDPLWASPNIDMVGIDAYFPLTNKVGSTYDTDEIIEGWTSGEGWDFYYTDEARTTTAALAPQYAWKNIAWWWNNTHTNPNGVATSWVPNSKKIWFTEYGFPSVDAASNQPNVFWDPDSSESFFPRLSKGRIDTLAQRAAIAATEQQWEGSAMIERTFLWTWDARPFPFWPDLNTVWTDGELWRYGHWVNGKFGLSGLAAIVAQLCLRAGLSQNDFDVSRLQGLVDGFVLTRQQSVRQAIEQLMGAYFFDAVESDNVIRFVHRGSEAVAAIPTDDILPMTQGESRSLMKITRMQEVELPQQVSVIYLNKTQHYQAGHQIAQRSTTESEERTTLNVPIVMAESQAQSIAEITLYTAWMGHTQFMLTLPPRYMGLEPCDVIEADDGTAVHMLRITRTRLGTGNVLQVHGVAEDITTYDAAPQLNLGNGFALPANIPQTQLHLLDIPALPNDNPAAPALRLAATPLANGWNGAVVYRSADAGQNYNRLTSLNEAAVMGTALDAIGIANPAFRDDIHSLTILLLAGGEVFSTTEEGLLNGANAALLGDEIIQFQSAEMLAAGKYRLNGLLRGRMGTEWAMDSHSIGERFILLDGRLGQDDSALALLGLPRLYKAVSIGSPLSSAEDISFTYTGAALRPYAPVHLQGTRDSSGNLTLSWIRRARLQGEWREYADVPLLEESERYEVEILDGSDVVRVIASTTPAASYSATEQVADFGSTQTSLSVKVYQLSAVVGRGRGASGVI
jgi:hypothetical protein